MSANLGCLVLRLRLRIPVILIQVGQHALECGSFDILLGSNSAAHADPCATFSKSLLLIKSEPGFSNG